MSEMTRLDWFYNEDDQAFWHCGRRAYWETDYDRDDAAVFCSKCQEQMPDETPTTDVIRHWCAWGYDDDFSQERSDQFDRWLADQLAAERDRIIAKIKEEYGEDYYDMGVVGVIIKIIKEEGK